MEVQGLLIPYSEQEGERLKQAMDAALSNLARWDSELQAKQDAVRAVRKERNAAHLVYDNCRNAYQQWERYHPTAGSGR